MAGVAIGAIALAWRLTELARANGLRAADAFVLRSNGVRLRFGIERTLDTEPLEAIESWASSWEAIDNALQAEAWRVQPSLAHRVEKAAGKVMSDLIYWACRPASETEFKEAAMMLRQLEGGVESVMGLLAAYARPGGVASDAPLPRGSKEVADLEATLLEIELGRLI